MDAPAAEDVRRQKELLETIFDHMPCMFNVLGPGAKPLMVNREWTKVLGWTAQELEGRDLLSVLYPDRAERHRAVDFISASDRTWGDFRLRVKNGGAVDTSWANFRLSDGTLIGIGQDITERKRAQRTLQARARQQAALARLGAQALLGQALDGLLEDTAWVVSQALEVDGSGVFRTMRGGRDLHLVAGVGWARGLVGRTRVRARSRSLPGCTLVLNEPVVAPDLKRRSRFQAPLLKRQGAVSAAAMVIGRPDHPLGAITAFSRHARSFTSEDLHFLEVTAHLVATAIIRKEQEEARQQLLRRLMSTQEEERRRIARELHDETGQALTTLLVRLRALSDSRSLDEAVSQAAELRRLAADAIDDLGRLARGLSPSVLENLGLRPALERLAAEEATAFGLRIDLDAGDLGSERLPADLETAVYRIVQEALANAGKHAAAGRIWILLARENGAVKVTVRDDGCGFDSEGTLRTSAARGRLGLHGMRERAMMLGGQLHIASKRGFGTTVSARIPVAARPRGHPGAPAKGSA